MTLDFKKRMKPETGNLSNKVGRGLRTRRCLQVSALAFIALAMTGCITVGYDFLRQQATLTYTKPAETGLKK
jgi:hypothetical protein